ncbi:hypothetical protein DICVIV_04318 [Dictyocaulus viviparus]|uniref:Uncharacterized protein n=1 Tax=Dictyocaulus viviparus TaxID=29172 RepID=A0A0D8XYF7_DICVI|nr:hypothetical protein DICVIV_04318 [Dictyocaulus viviparus]
MLSRNKISYLRAVVMIEFVTTSSRHSHDALRCNDIEYIGYGKEGKAYNRKETYKLDPVKLRRPYRFRAQRFFSNENNKQNNMRFIDGFVSFSLLPLSHNKIEYRGDNSHFTTKCHDSRPNEHLEEQKPLIYVKKDQSVTIHFPTVLLGTSFLRMSMWILYGCFLVTFLYLITVTNIFEKNRNVAEYIKKASHVKYPNRVLLHPEERQRQNQDNDQVITSTRDIFDTCPFVAPDPWDPEIINYVDVKYAFWLKGKEFNDKKKMSGKTGYQVTKYEETRPNFMRKKSP